MVKALIAFRIICGLGETLATLRVRQSKGSRVAHLFAPGHLSTRSASCNEKAALREKNRPDSSGFPKGLIDRPFDGRVW